MVKQKSAEVREGMRRKWRGRSSALQNESRAENSPYQDPAVSGDVGADEEVELREKGNRQYVAPEQQEMLPCVREPWDSVADHETDFGICARPRPIGYLRRRDMPCRVRAHITSLMRSLRLDAEAGALATHSASEADRAVERRNVAIHAARPSWRGGGIVVDSGRGTAVGGRWEGGELYRRHVLAAALGYRSATGPLSGGLGMREAEVAVAGMDCLGIAGEVTRGISLIATLPLYVLPFSDRIPRVQVSKVNTGAGFPAAPTIKFISSVKLPESSSAAFG
ncbi:hypothetical protein K438DRAFT_1934750 [Mycena galopus ATCC 62051]|nr:hypothetical protein K438DRAFT_1934750 [Mycena galopus ATCC 62051]